MKYSINLQTTIIMTLGLSLLLQFNLYKTNQKNNQHLQIQVKHLQAQLALSTSSNTKLQQRVNQVKHKLKPEYYNVARRH
jgi:hypothetical protein